MRNLKNTVTNRVLEELSEHNIHAEVSETTRCVNVKGLLMKLYALSNTVKMRDYYFLKSGHVSFKRREYMKKTNFNPKCGKKFQEIIQQPLDKTHKMGKLMSYMC